MFKIENGKSMSLRTPHLTALSCVLLASALTFSGANAQSQQQQADQQNMEMSRQQENQRINDYNRRSREESGGSGPAPAREQPVNFGGLAWYEKSPGLWGYVFVKGWQRDFSVSIDMDMECEKRRLRCDGLKLVTNAWLAIGSYNDRVHFATATGLTRAEAEERVHEQCRTDGTTCTIKDNFEVMPDRRGVHRQSVVRVVR